MLRRSTTFHLVESWNLHYNQIFVIILSDYYVSKSTFSITYSPGSNKSGFSIPLCFFSVLGSRLELSHNTFGIDNVNDFSRFSLGVEIDEEKQGRTSEWGLERGREERRGWKKTSKIPRGTISADRTYNSLLSEDNFHKWSSSSSSSVCFNPSDQSK